MLEKAVDGQSHYGVGTCYRKMLTDVGKLLTASVGGEVHRTAAGKIEEKAVRAALKDQVDLDTLPLNILRDWEAGRDHAAPFQHSDPPPPPVTSVDLGPLITTVRFY